MTAIELNWPIDASDDPFAFISKIYDAINEYTYVYG